MKNLSIDLIGYIYLFSYFLFYFFLIKNQYMFIKRGSASRFTNKKRVNFTRFINENRGNVTRFSNIKILAIIFLGSF